MAETFIQKSRRVPPAEKAAFHHVTGAGPKRVTRKFFGLHATDERAILERLERHLDRRMKGH